MNGLGDLCGDLLRSSPKTCIHLINKQQPQTRRTEVLVVECGAESFRFFIPSRYPLTTHNRWPLALDRGWVDHDCVRSVIRYAANHQRVAPAN